MTTGTIDGRRFSISYPATITYAFIEFGRDDFRMYIDRNSGNYVGFNTIPENPPLRGHCELVDE
jgi:hypothetical protein